METPVCHGHHRNRCFAGATTPVPMPWAPVYDRVMDAGGSDPDKPPQGWFVDPFGRHEARWFSQGSPTALVRDGRREAQDAPPGEPVTGPLVPAKPAPRSAPPVPDGPVGGPHPVGRAGRGAGDPQGHLDGSAPVEVSGAHAGGGTGRPRATGKASPAPPVPGRVLRTRWIALGGAVVWSILTVTQFMGSQTTVGTGVPGRTRTESMVEARPGAVVFLLVLVAVGCGVTAAGFVRRVRRSSEDWGRSGCVCAACLGLLGVASLASIGLALVLLAVLLFVVARPIRRPRPMPGESVVGSARPT